jgi:hypothetical protein
VDDGHFRWCTADGTWLWSDRSARRHGDDPAPVEATTESLLSRIHHGDRIRVADTLADLAAAPRRFTLEYRMVRVDRSIRHVAMVATEVVLDAARAATLVGSVVDLSSPVSDVITAKVTEIVGRRAAVEQTKGMLMLVYGLDEHDAFEVLKWLSQQHNVKLRPLARQIAADFGSSGAAHVLRPRFDRLLAAAPMRTSRTER